ncbi:hypothetical protein C2S53_013755 [Perilla frutescens var. hirtella]|uniref:F-box associated beta-propeller type 1 domain-containing protein n=1 Tax=Perilla frutescens var. hirtella TaxID=608512 RepID=A0AAD4P7E0_PERFH|nr:hypothetical protein C2S53_013755 [Perilla frutescens var. hirtella]
MYDSSSDDRSRYFSRISTSLDLRSAQKLYPPFSEKNPHVCVNICNGLLCLQYPDGAYHLWNPSTGDFTTLPPLEPSPYPYLRQRDHKKMHGCNTSLVIPYSYGLGFDCKDKDYKLIRFIKIYYVDNHDHLHSVVSQVAIYSLKNDSWKGISSDRQYYDICDARATYLNGRFYWRAPEHIVSFDLVDEKFSKLPFSDVGRLVSDDFVFDLMDVSNLENNNYVLDLMEFDGSLGVVAYTRLGVEKLFAFWVLEIDGSCSWTRKFNYDVCTSDVEKPLGLCRNGELLLLERFDNKLVIYDYSVGELKKIDQLYDYPCMKVVFSYVESMVIFKTKKER